MKRKTIIAGLCLLCMQAPLLSQKPQAIKRNQIASFMPETATGSLHHYIVEPDGALSFFKPGEKPSPVAGIDNVKEICSGQWHILALKNDGTVWTWGAGTMGRLGNGDTQNTSVPIKVPGIENAVAISSYEQTCLALLEDGTVKAGGTNYKGQLGNGGKTNAPGTFSAVPVTVSRVKNAVDISAHAVCIALLKDSSIMVWGWNEVGGLGRNRGYDFNVADTLSLPEYTVTAKHIPTGKTLKLRTAYEGDYGNSMVAGFEPELNFCSRCLTIQFTDQ